MKNYLPISAMTLMVAAILFTSCKKDKDPVEPVVPVYNLVLKYKFDSTQVRLNNLGQPEPMPAGHAGQSPRFNKMSSHYIELAQTRWTALGQGEVVYLAPETTAGGDNAINFSQSSFAGDGEVFFKIPLKRLKAYHIDFANLYLP